METQLSRLLSQIKDHEYLLKRFTQLAVERMPQFTIDDQNKKAIEQLCYFFSEDSRFNGDLKKGICLAGPVGSGKTLLMKVFFDLLNKISIEKEAAWRKERQMSISIISHELKSSMSLVESFLKDGMKAFEHIYLEPKATAAYCFDDIGCEPFESKYMGNTLGVMSFLITKRYEKGGPFRNIFFTSNLGKSQLETAYGTRVKSRLVEMVNFIHLLGNDRRQ